MAFSCLLGVSSPSDVLLFLPENVSSLSSSPCHRHGPTILVICAGFFTMRFQLVRLGMTAVQLGHQRHLMGTARWVANSHLQAESTELANICGPRAQRACDDAQPLRGSLSRSLAFERERVVMEHNVTETHSSTTTICLSLADLLSGKRSARERLTLRKISNTCHKNVSRHLQSTRLMVVIQLTPRTSVFVRAAIKWCSA